MSYRDKVVTLDSDLINLGYRCRNAGYKLTTTNGYFDLLHPGHIMFLHECALHGDLLLVFINSDKCIRKAKGRNPIYSQYDRLMMIASLECVSFVYIFDDDDPRRVIELVRPSIHVNASAYGYNCIEADTVRSVGGELVLVDKLAPYSTTDLINMIKEKY